MRTGASKRDRQRRSKQNKIAARRGMVREKKEKNKKKGICLLFISDLSFSTSAMLWF